jgi:hypothetical protein
MEFFLPNMKWFILLILLFMLMFPFLQSLVPSLAPLTLVILAAVALFFTMQSHISLFSNEYNVMEWTTTAASIAPTLLVSAVVVFAIGYILLLFGGGKSVTLPTLNRSSTPPPNTATNIVTETIGNGLNTIKRGVEENIKGRNLYSMSPSLEKNVDTSKLRSALASRIARAV